MKHQTKKSAVQAMAIVTQAKFTPFPGEDLRKICYKMLTWEGGAA